MSESRRSKGMEWRAMVRLPRELGEEVERLAADSLVEPAVMLRQLVKQRLDEIRRERVEEPHGE